MNAPLHLEKGAAPGPGRCEPGLFTGQARRGMIGYRDFVTGKLTTLEESLIPNHGAVLRTVSVT